MGVGCWGQGRQRRLREQGRLRGKDHGLITTLSGFVLTALAVAYIVGANTLPFSPILRVLYCSRDDFS